MVDRKFEDEIIILQEHKRLELQRQQQLLQQQRIMFETQRTEEERQTTRQDELRSTAPLQPLVYIYDRPS